jgi:hypothetical protein
LHTKQAVELSRGALFILPSVVFLAYHVHEKALF